jgi:arginase
VGAGDDLVEAVLPARLMAGFAAIGVPIDSVGRSGGTELSPSGLRSLGLVEALGATDEGDLDVSIRDDGRDPITGIVGSEDVIATSTTIREAVAAMLARGKRPFLIGGCCTELVGALAGARNVLGRVGLAYLDGHLDLYDGETSPTGEAADMPVSVVLGFGPSGWGAAVGGASARADDVAILGYRDLTESQTYGMRHPDSIPGLTHLSNETIRAEGSRATGERIAAALAASAGSFWLHLDVDVLDQGVFPATDYLMPDGLTWDELGDLIGPLASQPSLVGASLGCYNPEKDPGERCGRRLVDLWRDAARSEA